MKKNVMMRIASLLLVCVLATTCGISGTFAKYVTKAEANDTARVAKWGVLLTVSGEDLFANSYNGVDENADKVTVFHQTEDLVAPGTKNETGITFTITGTPEVAFKLTASLGTAGTDCQDVFLEAGTYTDYTQLKKQDDGTYAYSEKFTLNDKYNPVVFTLKHTFTNGAQSIKGAADAVNVTCVTNGNVDTITGTLEDINKVLEKLSELMSSVDPNYVLNDSFTLTWAWDFDANGAGTNDKADTLLGNLASDAIGDYKAQIADKYNLDLAFNFSITIEQVD